MEGDLGPRWQLGGREAFDPDRVCYDIAICFYFLSLLFCFDYGMMAGRGGR